MSGYYGSTSYGKKVLREKSYRRTYDDRPIVISGGTLNPPSAPSSTPTATPPPTRKRKVVQVRDKSTTANVDLSDNSGNNGNSNSNNKSSNDYQEYTTTATEEDIELLASHNDLEGELIATMDSSEVRPLVSHTPDIHSDWFNPKRKPPINSALDSLAQGTMNITSDIVKGGDGSVMYTWKQESGYTKGGSLGNISTPKPGVRKGRGGNNR